MKCPKCKEELFRKTSEFDYVPPVGEWDYMGNITCIIANLLSKYPSVNIELSQKEFSMFMSTHGIEAVSSLLLDKRFEDKKRAGINSIFKEGFEFRGIKVRVRD